MNVGTPYDLRTPLHLASAAGHLKMVQYLVEECGATLSTDRFGLLPSQDAVQNGHEQVRRYLQSKKLDPNLVAKTEEKKPSQQLNHGFKLGGRGSRRDRSETVDGMLASIPVTNE